MYQISVQNILNTGIHESENASKETDRKKILVNVDPSIWLEITLKALIMMIF